MSTAVDLVVPDAVTPLVGWRAWSVRGLPALRLVSVFSYVSWLPGHNVVVAECRPDANLHGWQWRDLTACPEAPTPGCNCGIHACADPSSDVLHEAIACSLASVHGGAVGRVALWGRVVQHEDGFRAQYARLTGLVIGHPALWRLSDAQGAPEVDLARRYKVPLLTWESIRE